MCLVHCSNEWEVCQEAKGAFLLCNLMLTFKMIGVELLHFLLYILTCLFSFSHDFMVLNPVIGKYSQLPGSGKDFKVCDF